MDENLYITVMALVGFRSSAIQALTYQNCDILFKASQFTMDTFYLFREMFFKASQHAMDICSKVGSLDIFNQCLKRVVWGRFRDYCIKDTCANSTSYVPLCSMMSALAHECTEAGEVIDWMSDPTLQQYCKGIFI